jgi:hypothetical protein
MTSPAAAAKNVISHAVSRFWYLLDSESVRLFVWPYYFFLLLWGIYASIWAQPISIVEPALGHWFYNFWVWMQIPGTLSVMIGLVLRHGGKSVFEMTSPALFRDYLGLWMQFGGHSCMGFILAAYEIAAIRTAYWGQAVFSIFAIAPFVLGCAFLALQTARKLVVAEGFHRTVNGNS